MNNFRTINDNVNTEMVVKKSKFICNLIKVESREEAEAVIKQIKKKFYNARHNCYAYRVLEDEIVIDKSSDDGEPSGTAGGPILNILQKNNLCNVVCIVTRYFGGILLGTGGLVKSYSDVTLEAINCAQKLEICMGIEIECVLEYNNLQYFKHYCKINDIHIKTIDFLNKVVCKIQLEAENKEKLLMDYDAKKINLVDMKILSKKIMNKSITK